MSAQNQLLMSAALETALMGMVGNLPTATENGDSYDENVAFAYQIVDFIWNDTFDPGVGSDYVRESGQMVVRLCYPKGIGSGDAIERAGIIKTFFKRGASFLNGGVLTVIEPSPSMKSGATTPQRYIVPVFIPFYANIAN